MKKLGFGLFSLAIMIALAAAPARGALVISEVLFNEVGSDTTGEWIEIFNAGAATIDLTNYKIGDEETSLGIGATEAMVRFPSGASIAPGAVQIVAVSATRFNAVYSFMPTYELAGGEASVPDMLPYLPWDGDGGVINLSNSNDQAVLLDGTDAVVDAVNWGNNSFLNPGLAQPVADGRSYERIDPYVDTNTAADWQLGPDGASAALRSTPGTVPVPEPSSLALALGLAACGLVIRKTRISVETL